MFQKLQQLVYGDRGAFLFIPKTKKENRDYILPAKILHKIAQDGYAIANSKMLLKYPKEFIEQFEELTRSSQKEGIILRKGFGSSEDLEDYTKEEWRVVLAMYAIRYGWSDEYSEIVGKNPSDITEEYLSDELFRKKFSMPTTTKVVQVWGMGELRELIGDIISSKVPLRVQQKETLSAFGEIFPDELAILTNELSEKIVIKEILILIAKLTKNSQVKIVAFKSIKDVLRFIALNYAKYPIEGIITNRALQQREFTFKTSDKKFIKSEIESLVLKKGFKNILEDMFPNEKFWRRIHNLLSYQSQEKELRRYPNYHALIAILKDNSYDRSWTYNSRFTRSLQEYRYDNAIELATQRAGVFFRHLILFLKMRDGEKIPKKGVVKKNKIKIDETPLEKERLKEQLSQLFGYTLQEKSSLKKRGEYVEHGATNFFYSKAFDSFLEKELNPKLGYQVLEEMSKEEHYLPIRKREVQKKHIKYSVPIPALDRRLAYEVSSKIKGLLNEKKYLQNRALGRVYVDNNIAIPLYFSGREEKSISFSGSFLSKFTRISIDELKNDENPIEIMRVGVMWRGLTNKDSNIDLDHSLYIDSDICYYGEPVYKSFRGDIVAVSSGDWTYCPTKESDMFATELVDVDINEAILNKNKTITSFVNNFSSKGLDRAEIYFFINFISKEDRVQEEQKIEISLDKVDYAIKLPKTKKSGSFGISLSLKESIVTVLNQPVSKVNSGYSNAKSFKKEYKRIMKEAKKAPSLAKVLKSVVNITHEPKEADVIIAYNPEKIEGVKEGATLINPLKELERVNALLF